MDIKTLTNDCNSRVLEDKAAFIFKTTLWTSYAVMAFFSSIFTRGMYKKEMHISIKKFINQLNWKDKNSYLDNPRK